MTHFTRAELLLAPLVAVVLAAIAKAVSRTPRVRAKALLTERERAAQGIIKCILLPARVHVQVSMAALLQPKGGFGRNEATRTRYTFSQNIVDFVIEDRLSGAILALVELDDRSHDASRDRQRDPMTASAGYRTIRMSAGRLSMDDMAARLQSLHPTAAIPRVRA